MIKLKRKTWYYIYTDGEDLFISDEAPIRGNKEWHHPELPLKITGQIFHVPDLRPLENIVEFHDLKINKPSITPISFQ